MATSYSDSYSNSASRGPGWASALGVVAIVLGVFLTGYHGNELMKQAVTVNAMPASDKMPAADCPQEELEEEGLTLAECEYLVSHIEGIALSTPDWFPTVQMGLAATGMVLAFISIIVGGALVNYKSSAVTAAILVFAALTLVDVAQFTAVVNTGPLLRDIYLWNILLWFLIHMMMMVAAIAGRHSEAGV